MSELDALYYELSTQLDDIAVATTEVWPHLTEAVEKGREPMWNVVTGKVQAAIKGELCSCCQQPVTINGIKKIINCFPDFAQKIHDRCRMIDQGMPPGDAVRRN